MQITATQIVQWAETREAHGDLPMLVRRLIHEAGGHPKYVDFPAGDSISRGGWDGEVESKSGNTWVPQGRSFWEMSCQAYPTKKANQYYKKRTKQTLSADRFKATFVFVSARRWTTRKKWLQEKHKKDEWQEICAYDADDLEQWLEQSPAVALWFAETLGLAGPGVESPERYWEAWSNQSNPPITLDAFFVSRENTCKRLISKLQKDPEKGTTNPVTIQADSVEEAVAFACATILTHADLSATSLVVTEPTGWRFVGMNPTLKVAIAARPEVAEKPVLRTGLAVVIPYASGDIASGVAEREAKADITLECPRLDKFKEALVALGVDKNKTERFSRSMGRSWSVFRRRCAINPAIRKPQWLETSQATALSTLCLLGAWSSSKPGDREVVSQLADRRYEEIDKDLRHLAGLDDSPVLQIGAVWKARSPLELLDLFGERITTGELDRFFESAHEILAVPNPVLDLPEEQRYAAQIYGKVRPQSDILIRAICDTLIKLAVRGPLLPSLVAAGIEGRVAGLVHSLLYDADGTRWLSLSSRLPSLAEAAPDTFLKAVEQSLTKPDAPVTRLLTETSDSALFGRCWHAGLLRALEMLAWSPKFLPRAALIAAKLTHVKIAGNWGNTPQRSLLGIFRSWLPQTATSLEERIEVLDLLIEREPDVAFDLLDGLVYINRDDAFPAARPKWRDYNTGAGHRVSGDEVREMILAAADRLISSSKGRPDRVTRLIDKLGVFDGGRVNKVLALAAKFAGSEATGEEKEIVRAALRKKIHWHRNYDKTPEPTLGEKLKPLEELYEHLTPKDLVVRHRWLFAEGWPRLPACVRDDYTKSVQRLSVERVCALREIYAERGITGIEQLAKICPSETSVGITLAKLGIKTSILAEWILEKGGESAGREPLVATIRGLLHTLPEPDSTQLIQSVLQKGQGAGWDAKKIARFLTLAQTERTTWETVASLGDNVEKTYWAKVPVFHLQGDEPNLEFPLRRLLKTGRPRTAMQACALVLGKVDPHLLADILEQLLHVEEPEAPHPDQWLIGRVFDLFEASAAIEQERLIRLEFWFFPTLSCENEQPAKTFYATLMSDPAFFVGLLCILYKPEHGEREEPPSESVMAAAKIAWMVFQNCRRLPGMRPDGTVNSEAFIKFIEEARELCRERDRLTVCNIALGQILSHSPAGQDGIWPFEPARDILDRPELEDIRKGFKTGTINKHGAPSYAPDEGGSQERALAANYRHYANALRTSHPNLAAVLDELDHTYEHEGTHEDLEARLRREVY